MESTNRGSSDPPRRSFVSQAKADKAPTGWSSYRCDHFLRYLLVNFSTCFPGILDQVYIDTQGAQLRTWKIYPKTTDDQFRHDGKADGQRSCWQFTLWKALSFWILWGSMLVKPATFPGRGWENQQSIFQKVSRNGSEGSNAELLGDLKTWRLFFALWTASLVYLRHTYS